MKGVTLVLVGILILHVVYSQLSKPIANDEQLQKLQNSSPYANKKAVQKQDISFGQDATKFVTQSKCKHVDLDIRWQSTVGSSVYQTPVAFDLFSDGKQELIVPTFVRYLEVLQGTNGAEAQAAFTAHHIRTSAQNQLSHDHVLQQWPFSHPNFASHSSPLLYDIDKDGQMEIVQALVTGEVLFFKQSGKLLPQYTIKVQPLKVRKDWYRGLDETNVEFSMSLQNEKPSQNAEENLVPNKNAQKRKLFSIQSEAKEVMEKRPRKTGVKDAMEGYFSKEAIDAMELISYIPQSMRPFVDPKDELNIFYSKRYEEELQQRQRDASKDQVFVDAHILATPVIADIDDDGHDELILSVSYYFDREYYSKPENIAKLDIDVEIGKFIAGGLVVIDLANLNKKWDVHLDLTTDKTKLKAYIYSSPTVADIDSDGSLDVVIGTALGFVYAFDKYGSRKDGFPFVMGQIQGQITAEDVNGDGDIELCAVDFKSNLICLNGKGKIIWERQLSGFCSQSIAVGDINGDGVLELVVGTSTGHIWAVRGDNGKVLQNFPIKTNGPIYATALLTQVNTTVSSGIFTSLIQRTISKGSATPNSLTIVIPSFDGYLYLIDGYDGCTDKIDVGEKSYSQVLATDLTGSGKLDLVVSTMNGNVYCFGTAQNYHPLRASTMQIQSLNGFAYRYNYHGIYVKHESRIHRDVIGSNFKVQFEIVDNRKMPFHIPRNYKVKISIGKYKELFTRTYTKPGVYVEVLPTPSERMYGTVVVEMHNEKGQAYVDSFSVSFNMGFLATVKWAIVMPFVLVCVLLLYVSKGSQEHLPS